MPRKRRQAAPQPLQRSALSAVLTALRILRGMLQTELARAAGVKPGTISEYEGGEEPRPDVAGRVALALGVSLRIVEALADLFAALSSLLDRLGSARIDAFTEDIVTGAIRCAVLVVRGLDAMFAPPARQVPVVQDPLAASGLWERLEPLEPEVRQAVVQEGPEFHSPALAELLRAKSVQLAAEDADRAAELADLARLVAEQIHGQTGGRLSQKTG